MDFWDINEFVIERRARSGGWLSCLLTNPLPPSALIHDVRGARRDLVLLQNDELTSSHLQLISTFRADTDSFVVGSLKTFIDNVTIQVVERHIVHGLEEVFSPLVVAALDNVEVSDLASEPQMTARQREHLEGRRNTHEKGQGVFRSILRHKIE